MHWFISLYIYIYIYICNLYIHIYFLPIICPDHHYRFSFLKIIPKSIFYQLLQEKAHLIFSTASTITHYPFLGDLHILLFILHFFMHLITVFIVNLTLHMVSRQLKKKIRLETRKQDESCQNIQDARERERERRREKNQVGKEKRLRKKNKKKKQKKMFRGRNC